MYTKWVSGAPFFSLRTHLSSSNVTHIREAIRFLISLHLRRDDDQTGWKDGDASLRKESRSPKRHTFPLYPDAGRQPLNGTLPSAARNETRKMFRIFIIRQSSRFFIAPNLHPHQLPPDPTETIRGIIEGLILNLSIHFYLTLTPQLTFKLEVMPPIWGNNLLHDG